MATNPSEMPKEAGFVESSIGNPPRPDVSRKEAVLHGQYSLTPAEEAKIREEAKERGQDQDEAVRFARDKMSGATERLRGKQGEESLGKLKEDIERIM